LTRFMKLTDKQRRAMFARIGRTSLRENKSVPHVHLLVSPDYERLRKEREEVGVALKVAKDYYGKAIEEAITKYPPMVGGWLRNSFGLYSFSTSFL
jgi:hypothetical protein